MRGQVSWAPIIPGVDGGENARHLEADLARARAQLAETEARIRNKRIHAPFAGTIGIRRVDLGEYITPGTVIASLQDRSQLDVDFTLPARYAPSLHPGLDVTLKQIETTPFFQTVRGELVTGIYNNPAVWRHFGYEGASAAYGGYYRRAVHRLARVAGGAGGRG